MSPLDKVVRHLRLTRLPPKENFYECEAECPSCVASYKLCTIYIRQEGETFHLPACTRCEEQGDFFCPLQATYRINETGTVVLVDAAKDPAAVEVPAETGVTSGKRKAVEETPTLKSSRPLSRRETLKRQRTETGPSTASSSSGGTTARALKLWQLEKAVHETRRAEADGLIAEAEAIRTRTDLSLQRIAAESALEQARADKVKAEVVSGEEEE